MIRSARLSLSLILLALTVRGEAAEPQLTGGITGTVVAHEIGTPLVRGAVLELRDARGVVRKTAISDIRGHFSFPDIPLGRYSLRAVKAGLLPTSLDAVAPGRDGRSVVLTNVRPDMSVVVKMFRGAVITGTITATSGRPLRDVAVLVARVGAAGRDVAHAAYSDDLGAFRVYGLMPGDYLVFATPSAGVGLQPLRAGPSRDTGDVVAAPIFYPGVPSLAAALPVRVVAGQEQSGIDFTVRPVSAGTLTGALGGSDGRRLSNIDVQLMPLGPAMSVAYWAAPRAMDGPTPDGRFTFGGVVPGRYLLVARASDAAGVANMDWYAESEIEATGGDMTAPSLVLQAPTTVSGRLTLHAAQGERDDRRFAPRLVLTREPRPDQLGAASVVKPIACVASANLAVQCGRVPAGAYRVSLDPASASGWFVSSSEWRGASDEDGRVTIGHEAGELVVTLSNQAGAVQGTIETPPGGAVDDYSVVVLPVDSRLWRTGSRRIASARLADDGSFVADGLPDGEYCVGAVTGLKPGDLDDTSFLELVKAAATVVRVDGRQPTTVRLKVGG
jgi:hypothetical protein